ncbi:Protein RFT1-like protein, partial [Stegodyphus mimosarum]
MMEASVVNVAVKSASYNIILQILMRIVSSLSNAVILRFIAKDALGVINVRLMLLYSTCHCITREAFRRSCLSKINSRTVQSKFNLLWLTLPTCVLCSIVLRYIWLYLLDKPDPAAVPNYTAGVNIVLVSVFIETLSEPLFVFSQSFHFVKLKVFIEGVMLSVKSIAMVIFLSKWPDHAMFSFCLSQALGSVVYTLSYYVYFSWYLSVNRLILPVRHIKDILPKFSKQFVDWEDYCLTWSFFKQTFLKQLLTEGERYLMTFFTILSFGEQGLYDVVNNLGSLAARFLFLPIEESGYLLFTQLINRDQPIHAQKNLTLSLSLLENLLKLMVLLGLMILTFGYSYSQLLLLLYGGPILSTGKALTLMRWHCAYVFLLAINGITECFKFAVMNHYQVNKYNKKMVMLSVIFLVAAYCFVHLFGGVGFILANCLNMGFRIIHSIFYIHKYFKMPRFWLVKNVIPHSTVTTVLCLTFVLTSISEVFLCCSYGILFWIWHLILGIGCFTLFIWA